MPSIGERLSQLASQGPGPYILSYEQETRVEQPLVCVFCPFVRVVFTDPDHPIRLLAGFFIRVCRVTE